MKKRFVLGLVLLASISMLLSSFARASELKDSVHAELLTENEKDLKDVQDLLKEANDTDSREVIQARLIDLQAEHEQLSTQLD